MGDFERRCFYCSSQLTLHEMEVDHIYLNDNGFQQFVSEQKRRQLIGLVHVVKEAHNTPYVDLLSHSLTRCLVSLLAF